MLQRQGTKAAKGVRTSESFLLHPYPDLTMPGAGEVLKLSGQCTELAPMLPELYRVQSGILKLHQKQTLPRRCTSLV